MAERIGFLGPGLMGRGIVKNLLKKGFPVTVFWFVGCMNAITGWGLDYDEIIETGQRITTPLHAFNLREGFKPGDFVLIQFGHNDGGEIAAGKRPRASLKGIGDETQEVTLESTGQTALLTGVNAAAAMGRHVEAFPGRELRRLIEAHRW